MLAVLLPAVACGCGTRQLGEVRSPLAIELTVRPVAGRDTIQATAVYRNTSAKPLLLYEHDPLITPGIIGPELLSATGAKTL